MPPRLPGDAAAEIMLAAGVGPSVPYPGSCRPWPSLCLRCGRRVAPRLDNVRAGHAACGFCAGQAVDPVDALVEVRAAGLQPLEGFPGVWKLWRCRCAGCGLEVVTRLADIRRGRGCRACRQPMSATVPRQRQSPS